MIITALGAAALIGIQATSIDMRDIADKMYKEHNLYDIQLKSAAGFNASDIDALKETAGAAAVMPTYIYDVFVDFKDEVRIVRTYAIPDSLNTIDLLEGRLPNNSSECVVEQNFLRDGTYSIGDEIVLTLDDADDYFNVFYSDTFTIVGTVSSPIYVSRERGHTSLGDGSLHFYIYLHPDAYKLEVYTDVYILMDGSQEMYNLTDDYYKAADEWKNIIKQTGSARVQALKNELADAQNEIDSKFKEIEDSQAELNAKLSELEYNQSQLEESLKTLDETSEQMKAMGIEGGSLELDMYYAQIYDALREIDDGRNAVNDAQITINDGIKELSDAQEKLNSSPVPEWFYFTRKDGVAHDSYYQDTLRLEKIGYVFPLVFFLVAIMVSLTSMSRMVDDHRTQIGVYKALGYRPAAIMMKYLIYAFTAGFTGGVAGVLLGSSLFPRVISDAYNYLYTMPPVETPIPVFLGIIAVTAGVASVMLVTLCTCISSMTGSPALLMRPKPPSAGKRVLLERIPFIWNRLNFTGKVTARNIFRYKKRFLMTVFGVAGCSALLLTGFGLRDSISEVSIIQYNEIVQYDTRIYTKDITSDTEREELDESLSGLHLFIREESVDAKVNDNGMSASLIVPEFPDDLNKFFNLHAPGTDESVYLESGGVIVTEKLARVMGVSSGDSFTITTGDGKTYTARVTGIADNYVMHYIYMPPEVYAEIFGVQPHLNSVLTFTDDKQGLAETMLKKSNVRAVSHTSDILSSLIYSTDAMSIVTIVLIVLACALALVVLFNLTNINISERIRELATIKVLGFYNSELALYVYRENGVVTFIGIISGLAGGIFLHRFVLASVEINILKFPVIIQPMSFVYSILLSLVFAVFVNWVMNYKLASIDMVESLKNVE